MTGSRFPKSVGVRLTVADEQKLQQLAAATQQSQGNVLRILIRLAQLTDLMPLRLDTTPVASGALQNTREG